MWEPGQQLLPKQLITVKSNLTDCKVTFNTKNLENSPASGAFLQTPWYVYSFVKYTLQKSYTLNLTVLIVFTNFLASPTEKSFSFASQTEKSFQCLWHCYIFMCALYERTDYIQLCLRFNRQTELHIHNNSTVHTWQHGPTTPSCYSNTTQWYRRKQNTTYITIIN